MSEMMDIATRRVVIETHIERCRDAALDNLVEIGRWLNTAKAEGLVPHGEWTAWVMKHAGMNERMAQRAMQYARELPENSPLARLGTAKLNALLTLPAGEREEVARDIDAQNATSREVEARVKAYRAERDEALRMLREKKKQLEATKQSAAQQVDRAVAEAIRAEREDARAKIGEMERELEQKESLIRSGEKGRKQTSKLLGEAQARAEVLRGDLLKSEAERVRLEKALAQAQQGGGLSLEAKSEIEALNAKIAQMAAQHKKQEEEIDRLSEELDATQMDLARSGAGGGMKSNPSTRILSAIGALMAEAGQAPAELARVVSPIDEETRGLLIAQANMVGQWAMSIITRLGGDMRG